MSILTKSPRPMLAVAVDTGDTADAILIQVMPHEEAETWQGEVTRAWASLAMEVVSEEMALAMPKSMSLSWPSTTKKFAGFRSLCTMRASWMVCTACRH